MSLSDDELSDDDPELDAYIDELTRDWPPPDSPAQLAVLRRVFGPRLTGQAPTEGTPRHADDAEPRPQGRTDPQAGSGTPMGTVRP